MSHFSRFSLVNASMPALDCSLDKDRVPSGTWGGFRNCDNPARSGKVTKSSSTGFWNKN